MKENISQKHYREIKSANTLLTVLRTVLDLPLIRKRKAHIYIIFPTTPNLTLYLIGVSVLVKVQSQIEFVRRRWSNSESWRKSWTNNFGEVCWPLQPAAINTPSSSDFRFLLFPSPNFTYPIMSIQLGYLWSRYKNFKHTSHWGL